MKRRDAILVPLLQSSGGLWTLALAQSRADGKPYRIALVPDGLGSEGLQAFSDALRLTGRIEGRDYELLRAGLEVGPPSSQNRSQ